MEKSTQVNYKQIFTDLILKKFPDKLPEYKEYLTKKELTRLEVIELNQKIFGTKERDFFERNQKLKSYDPSDIAKILDYQTKNNLNNSELADHFNMSRNTVASWKKRNLK